MKKTIVLISPLLFVSLFTTTAFAQVPETSENPGAMMKDNETMIMKDKMQVTPRSMKEMHQQQQDKMEKKMGTLQERADREITRRITSLKNLITRLNSFKRISEEKKEALTMQVQTEIDALIALQTKIKADSDPETLKTDVQSIVTSYRIYALFTPKIAILAMAERLDATADQVSTLATKLQTRIDTAKSEGKEVGGMQSTLLAMQKKIADAKTQEQNAIDAVIPLTPDGYPANKKTLQDARAMLQKGQQDLIAARKDAKEIVSALKK